MIEPMKAVLADKPFSDPNWIFERKLDGIRCLAIKDASGVTLMSRTGRRMNSEYPDARGGARAPALQGLHRRRRDRCLRERDHELLAPPAPRRGSGCRCSSTSSTSHLTRERTCAPLPLRKRKARLRRALEFGGRVRFNPHRNGEHGEELYRDACKRGLEGVIAKRADSPYLSGGRSRDWLKLKCHAEQELVIGGYTAPKGSRTEFGALLVGYYDESGALRYAGKVGTGFDQHTLRELGERLRRLEQDELAVRAVQADPAGHALGAAGAGRADRLRGVDARRPPAPPALPGPARRQARPRRGSGAAVVSRRDHPPRQAALPGRRDLEGRPRGLLRGRGRVDAAAREGPPREHAALSRRHRRQGLLPQGRPGLLPALDQARGGAEGERDRDPRW